jgi:hypothetical protein
MNDDIISDDPLVPADDPLEDDEVEIPLSHIDKEDAEDLGVEDEEEEGLDLDEEEESF